MCSIKNCPGLGTPIDGLRVIDLGGGCGGWLEYLTQRSPVEFSELALGDSSFKALTLAKSVVGPGVSRFQVDLLDLGWEDRWDVVFLLDVLEHLQDDKIVLREIRKVLRPGGLLFVTVPALKFFWSYNDEIALHQRRYSRKDLQGLAESSGLRLVLGRYFMFFLSPLILVRKLRRLDQEAMSRDSIARLLDETHRVPATPMNVLLRGVLSAETPLGVWFPFPWGTSIVGVFQLTAGEAE